MKQNSIFFLESDQFARFDRIAKILAESNFGIPENFRGNYGSCFVAVDIAYRLGVSPVAVLQNVRELNGTQVWDYKFIKSLIEASGALQGPINWEQISTPGDEENFSVRATATAIDGQVLTGPWITWKMASLEGWVSNMAYNSMPEVMFRARAISFFANQHFSHLPIGMTSAADFTGLPPVASSGDSKLLHLQVKDSAPGNELSNSLTSVLQSTTEVQLPETAKSQVSVTELQAKPPESAPLVPLAATSSEKSPTAKPEGTKATRKKAAPAPVAGVASDAMQPPADVHAQAPDLLSGVVDHSDPQANQQLGETGLASSTEEAADALPPLTTVGGITAAQQASIDGFSKAFNAVDSASLTKEGIDEAFALVKTFEQEERSDLLNLLLRRVEGGIMSVVAQNTSITKMQSDFASAAQVLHASTKTMQSCQEIIDSRAALAVAYHQLVAMVQSLRAAASAVTH